jgi:hypothetical protein
MKVRKFFWRISEKMAKPTGKKQLPYDPNKLPEWFTLEMYNCVTPPAGPRGPIPCDIFGRWKKLFAKNLSKVKTKVNTFAARA